MSCMPWKQTATGRLPATDSDADSGLGTPTSFTESSPTPMSPMSVSSEDASDGLPATAGWPVGALPQLKKRRPIGYNQDDDSDSLPWQQRQAQPRPHHWLARPAMSVASVPMRRRHLPPSMWREPDLPVAYSPALLPPMEFGGNVGVPAKALAGSRPPTGAVTTVVCAVDSEDSLRRMFDVAARAAAQMKLEDGTHDGCSSSSDLAQSRRPPPAYIRRRFVYGHDPRLSDSGGFGGGCGIGAGARRLPPLEVGRPETTAAAAAQLLGEVAAWL